MPVMDSDRLHKPGGRLLIVGNDDFEHGNCYLLLYKLCYHLGGE